MEGSDKQLWHDFMMGVHQRSVRSLEEGEWDSWQEAGQMFYGVEKYNTLQQIYELLLVEELGEDYMNGRQD